jgi:hypothetical protein
LRDAAETTNLCSLKSDVGAWCSCKNVVSLHKTVRDLARLDVCYYLAFAMIF